MESQGEVIAGLRAAFHTGVTIPLEFRLTELKGLLALMEENEDQILEALHRDLRKPKFEAAISEIEIVKNDICHAINNLKTWMLPEYVGTNMATKFDSVFIRRQPFGVVLIIGAWNYPLQLILLPLVGAIAAGNCALLKPSEISQATEALLAELIPKYLSKECYVVTCGGAEDTRRLLENRFDHIFYTGSQAVARKILLAAAVHLTPVTLELGGKTPCLIYGRIDMRILAKRIVWAKYFNAGQSCVAPDYILCTKETQDALLPLIREALDAFYGPDPQKCPDVGRIVTDKHWSHLMDLLGKSKGKVVIGGESTQEEKYIAPTVLVDVEETDILMQEEIFGPILPILTVETLEEAITFVNAREKPLALYVFSDEPQVVTTVMESTNSGGFCANDGILQMTLPTLPFGGVGASGMGCYHGRYTYETFSHKRACLLRSSGLERIGALRYPPYSDYRLSWLRWATTTKKGSCSLL